MSTSENVTALGTQENGLNVGNNLIIIHRVITRGLQVSIESCRTYSQQGFPDDVTRRGFVSYVQALATILHGHHTGEDTFAIPCFRVKIAGAPYEKLMADHRAMAPHLERIKGAVSRMQDGSNAALPELQTELDALQELWTPHIGQEEDHFSCQVLAAALSQKEHKDLEKEMSDHAQANSDPAFLTVPFMLYNLSGEDRAGMARLLPAQLTEHLVPVVWKDHWSPMRPFLLD